MNFPCWGINPELWPCSSKIMLFLCAKFPLKVRLDLAFSPAGQQLENWWFLRLEPSDGRCICFIAEEDFSVNSSRPWMTETESDLNEDLCEESIGSHTEIFWRLSVLWEGFTCPDGPEQMGCFSLFRPYFWERTPLSALFEVTCGV